MAAERPRRDLVLLAGALAVLLGLCGFVVLATSVAGDGVESFDATILRAMRQPDAPHLPIGPAWAAEVGRDLTALGSVSVLALVTVATAGFLLLQRKQHAMWLVLASAGGGMLLSSSLKHVFGRQRPSVVPHLVDVFSPS